MNFQTAFGVVVLLLFIFQTAAFSFTSSRGTSGFDLRKPKQGVGSTRLNAGKEICILGGGFGGLNTALTLSKLPWPVDQRPTITLVDNKERFVFLPLLYELCVDDAYLEEVAPTFEVLLKDSDVQFIQGEVYGIDKETNAVYIKENKGQFGTKKLKYDLLVIATGAGLNLEAVPGAPDFALPFYTLENCFELKKRLTLLDSIRGELARDIKVVISGGGYSGVELALNLKDRLSDMGKGVEITIIHRGEEILQYASDYNKKVGKERLNSAGINVMTESNLIEILPATDDTIDIKGRCRIILSRKDHYHGTISNEILSADILLWTAGTMSKNVQRGVLNSKFPRDSKGKIAVGPYLQVKDSENVFALGDCSRSKNMYGATAAVAMQQATHVAWNVFALAVGPSIDVKMIPFHYVSLGEMLTLGENDASISSFVELSGASASVLRRLIYAIRMPTVQQALTAAISSSIKRFEIITKKQRNRTKWPPKNIQWK